LSRWREGLTMAAGSVQRTVNDFKAALNAAAKRGKEQLPATVRDTIKDGLATVHAAPAVAREAQVLPDADVRAIISAAWEVDAAAGWQGDLGRIVVVLAATGARFSQVIRMTVADVQAVQKRLMVLERALAERDPDNPDLRDTAAACLDGLASAKIAMGDRQGALSDYKESVALTRKLADEQQDVEYQRQLVTSLIHYGDVILKLGDLAGAEAAYKESVAIARKVVALDNEDWNSQNVLLAGVVQLFNLDHLRFACLREALAIARHLENEQKLDATQKKFIDSLKATGLDITNITVPADQICD